MPTALARLLRLARFWLARGRHGDELAAEIEAHRAARQADLESRGMSPGEAAAASRRAMGNATLAVEDARAVWIAPALEALWRDAQYAARMLAREPLFAATAIVTFAAGLVVTTTVFSVVDAQLWKPLPYPSADRLMGVRALGPNGERDSVFLNGLDLESWRSETGAFSAVSGMGPRARRVLHGDTAESVLTLTVTNDFFSTLGRQALLGRMFAPTDTSPAAVITDRAWRRWFSGDTSMVGRSLQIDDQLVPVLGVVLADDALVPDPDVYLSLPPAAAELRDPANRAFNAIVRLRPGVSRAAALAELQALVTARARLAPDTRTIQRVEWFDLRQYNGYNWRPLYFFLGAALLVLALCCANVASLLLARALRRAREFAVRGALGGGSGALVRQLVVEGALISVPGAALGLLSTAWVLAAGTRYIPDAYLERGSAMPLDLRVAAFAFAMTAITTIAFGLAPAIFARRIDLNVSLGHGGRTAGRSRVHTRSRRALLVSQVALTFVLLAATGIFLKSFRALTSVPLGFERAGRLALRLTVSGPRFEGDDQIRAYVAALREQARAVPGIADVAIATGSPLGTNLPGIPFYPADRPAPAPGGEANAIVRAVDPAYFSTLGIALRRGRAFTDADAVGAPRVAIVNERLAGRFFADRNPIGARIVLPPGARTPWARRPGTLLVVGVVANSKDVGLDEADFNDLYVPFAQMPSRAIELLAHTTAAPAGVVAPLRAAVAAADPTIPVTSLMTLDARVDRALSEDRFNAMVVSGFAAMAVLLAAIGIYAAVAYDVQERTREFGLRVALGARPGSILAIAAAHGCRVGAAGGALGLAAALVAARLLGNALYLVPTEHNGLLYGVSTTDPTALGAALAGILILALAASAIPARRATRVDPLIALRSE